MEGKKILITGGAGSIGQRLAARLAQRNDVSVIDDLSSGRASSIPDGVRFVNGSILEPSSLRSAMSDDTDIVFHLAALFANQNSVEHPEADLMTNGLGTLRLLDAAGAAGVGTFVYASSSCVYGSQPGVLDEEDAPGELDTPYAITKYVGELYCDYFARQSRSMEVVKVRYFNVYGPGELPGRYRNVIPNFASLALAGEALPITGTGAESRDFTFVDDAVEGTILASVRGRSGAVYNLGTGTETTIKSLAETIIRIAGSSSEIVFKPKRAWDGIDERRSSRSVASDELGYMPSTALEDGLTETVEWLRSMLGG